MSFYAQQIRVIGSIDFEIIEMTAKETGGEMAETIADIFDFEMSW